MLWSCVLLVAALCPVGQAKRTGGIGGFFKGRGKGGQKEGREGPEKTPAPHPTRKSRFSPKQGLKLAGAAAAGAVGGAAVGYGLGSRGRWGHGPHGYSGKKDYQRDGHGVKNHFTVKSAAPTALGAHLLCTLWPVTAYLSGAWRSLL